jgi:hypothetical protein
MLMYESESLLTIARPKGCRGSCLGISLLRMSLSRNPKRILSTPAVAIDGKGRRDREAGNNGFWVVTGRAGCGEGDIGDARGDGTAYGKTPRRLTSLYLGTASRLRRRFGQAVYTHFVLFQKPVFETMKACSTA